MSTFPADELASHAASLRALARDLLADDGLADDAVQQAYVTALTRPPAGATSVAGWLRAVVRSCAIDLWRSEQRRRRREQRGTVAATTARDAAEQLELQEDIVAAVRALDEPYRTVVWLRYYEHRTPSEIAAARGEPVKTVKTRLARALVQLRQKLDGRYGSRRAWGGALATFAGATGSAPAIAGAMAVAAGGTVMHGKALVGSGLVLALLAAATVSVWPRDDAPAPTTPPVAAPTAAHAAAPPATVPAERQPGSRPAAASPAPGAETRYASLLVRVRWHDGTPAAHVAIHGTAHGEPQVDRNELCIVADEAGLAYAPRVHAGTVDLRSDRGGAVQTVLGAGQTHEIDFVLPRGVDVAGVVHDARERPVAGAHVVLVSPHGGWLGGRVVATTDDAGAFTVRAIDPKWSLGARAASYAPSALVDLEDLEPAPTATAPARIRLRLLDPGATVAGTCVDDDGAPIVGATVVLGRGASGHFEAGRTREAWSPLVVESGADGTFQCTGVQPGDQPIAARADGFTRATGSVTCVAGATATTTLVLSRGVTVRGTVRDEAGAPVADAIVTWLPPDRITDSLEFVIRDDRPEVKRAQVRSDALGAFELRGVPAGTLELAATKRRANDRAGFGQFVGVAATTRTAGGGEVVTWDPVLVAGKTLRVRVVDAEGAPAWIGGTLTAYAERPAGVVSRLTAFPERISDPSQPSGLCVLRNCADVPYTLALQYGSGNQRAWIYRRGVVPGGPDVELRLPPQPPPPVHGAVQGRIVDAGNRLTDRSVTVALNAWGFRYHAPVRGDRFAVADVMPGRYFAQVKADDQPVLSTPWFDLQPGQELDLGDLSTVPGAALRVALRTSDGAAVASPAAALDESYEYQSMRWDGTHLTAANLTPGPHRVVLRAAGWFAPPRDVDLVAGRDEVVTLDLVPGAMRRIYVDMPFPDQWQRATFVVLDADGRVLARDFASAGLGLEPHRSHVRLPFGTFTLEATVDGRRHTWPLDLRGPESVRPITFSLRGS